MEDVFDHEKDRIVTVKPDGSHAHLGLPELIRDMRAVTTGTLAQPVIIPPPLPAAHGDTPEDVRMMWAAILAVYAMVSGAETGDYRWHGGDRDFTWDVDGEPVRMDAETFFGYVQKQFERS